MSPLLALLRTLGPRRRRQFALAVALMLLGAAAELLTIGAALPFLALIASPDASQLPPAVIEWLEWIGGSAIFAAALLLIAAAVAAALFRLLLSWFSHRFVMAVGHDLAARIFGRMLRQPYSAYVKRSSSEILSGIEKVQAVVLGVLHPGMQALAAVVLSLFIVALLFLIDPLAAAVAALSVASIYAAVSLATHRRLRRNSKAAAEAATARIKVVQEGLGGIRDILLDHSQPLFEERFRRADARFRRSLTVNAFIAVAPRYAVEAAGIVALALVALAMSAQPGGLVAAIPVLGALALGAQRLLPLLQLAYLGWSQVGGNRQSVADLMALLDAPVVEDGPRPAAGAPRMLSSEIVFDSVSLARESGRFTLRDLSLVIPAGARVGLTGPTGSGKSSLLDLLMGLLEPESGEIRIEGRRLDSQTRPLWQAQIAHVPQSVYLAEDSIAANIAFGAPGGALDMDRVRAAARAAALEPFVAGLPRGYDTEVGERGVRLSGGQRQRIGIARALYKEAPVLILDEATSALDDETEAAVMRGIMALGDRVTVVIVAHRASTLAGCDSILRLEDGRLAGGPSA